MAELSGHLAGACSGRRAEGFDLHIGNGGRIPLKEQAGIVLKTSHNPVLSLAETLPGNAADLCGQGILFGFAQGNGGFRIDKWARQYPPLHLIKIVYTKISLHTM